MLDGKQKGVSRKKLAPARDRLSLGDMACFTWHQRIFKEKTTTKYFTKLTLFIAHLEGLAWKTAISFGTRKAAWGVSGLRIDW